MIMKSDIIEQEEKNWLESAVIVLRHNDRTAMHDKLDKGKPWKKSLVRHSYLKPIIFKRMQIIAFSQSSQLLLFLKNKSQRS